MPTFRRVSTSLTLVEQLPTDSSSSVTSMTLGRPALAPRKPAVPLPAALEDAYLEGMHATGAEPTDRFSKSTFFVQTLKLYTIFGEVLTNVYEPWQDRSAEALLVENHIDTSIKTVIDLERDLAGFKSALPQQLDWDGEHIKGNEPPFVERQRNILYARSVISGSDDQTVH